MQIVAEIRRSVGQDAHGRTSEAGAVRPAASEWWEWARCSRPDVDPDLFFPRVETKKDQVGAARALCGECPVARQCLRWALARPELTGVWAGTTTAQRRHLRAEAVAS
ncbi:WhiB family transcriptional regulator [Streptomyces sp. DSM 41982]|uniref:Transcriptional regulator WhiB n=1 Tax=Streptomyces evansiae TaxID=3075535 RepID=A0ABD5ECD0_9ACTN|nr:MULTISPECIES: WhiB family transcriptional regulator [unclassified Streptomyces]MDT0418857.1 WhiB family transcriptional regulator [Streptomyces sp. DSM 41982]SCD62394.1 WhiB family transcriptional regulator, redox-sensing transcriptional regulator [Streptomyces sp. SolWspMP-sol7th]